MAEVNRRQPTTKRSRDHRALVDDGTEELWTKHYGDMVRIAQSVLRRPDLAEEAAQEAFIRFIERRCEPRLGREGAYLRTMARNQALSTVRRAKTEERKLRSEIHGVAPPAEDEALRELASCHLRTLISQLPTRQRTVLMQRHIAGASVREIADELGLSTGSVKTHTYRAREAMRDALSSEGRAA